MPHLSSTFTLEELQSLVGGLPGIEALSSEDIKWRIDRIGEAFANVQYVLVLARPPSFRYKDLASACQRGE